MCVFFVFYALALFIIINGLVINAFLQYMGDCCMVPSQLNGVMPKVAL